MVKMLMLADKPIARISARATEVLCQATGSTPSEVKAYIGPHIGSADYEVSSE